MPKVELDKAIACLWMAFADLMDIDEAYGLYAAGRGTGI